MENEKHPNKTRPLVYTVAEVANILGVGLNTVYAGIKTKQIPSVRLSTRRYCIPKAAFHKWLDVKVALNAE